MLSDIQIGFFARNGFLHLKDFVDPETCRILVDHTWTRMPAEWKRDDQTSWTGQLRDSCHLADLRVRRGLLQFQKGDLLDHPIIQAAFSADNRGGELARSLIGHRLAKMRVRGLYAIVPLPETIKYKGLARPHIESHPAQLIALYYLADVVPGGGGLLVWPGSHRELYPSMGSKLEHVATPEYEAVYRKWARLQPIEMSGARGDVVLSIIAFCMPQA